VIEVPILPANLMIPSRGGWCVLHQDRVPSMNQQSSVAGNATEGSYCIIQFVYGCYRKKVGKPLHLSDRNAHTRRHHPGGGDQSQHRKHHSTQTYKHQPLRCTSFACTFVWEADWSFGCLMLQVADLVMIHGHVPDVDLFEDRLL
jgi:hypothetical protein